MRRSYRGLNNQNRGLGVILVEVYRDQKGILLASLFRPHVLVAGFLALAFSLAVRGVSTGLLVWMAGLGCCLTFTTLWSPADAVAQASPQVCSVGLSTWCFWQVVQDEAFAAYAVPRDSLPRSCLGSRRIPNWS